MIRYIFTIEMFNSEIQVLGKVLLRKPSNMQLDAKLVKMFLMLGKVAET